MKILKSIGVITLILIILISTTGVDIRYHRCSGMKSTDLSIYPSLTGSSGGCCNKVAPGKSGGFLFPHIQKTPCCKNTSIFTKIASVTFTQFFTNQLDFAFPFTGLLINAEKVDECSLNLTRINCSPYPPPPWSGRKFFTFTHQLRIPEPPVQA